MSSKKRNARFTWFMVINKINRTTVGADLSAFRGIHDIPLYLLKFSIGPGEPSRYPDLKDNLYYNMDTTDNHGVNKNYATENPANTCW
jgi:hypothetical protein